MKKKFVLTVLLSLAALGAVSAFAVEGGTVLYQCNRVLDGNLDPDAGHVTGVELRMVKGPYFPGDQNAIVLKGTVSYLEGKSRDIGAEGYLTPGGKYEIGSATEDENEIKIEQSSHGSDWAGGSFNEYQVSLDIHRGTLTYVWTSQRSGWFRPRKTLFAFTAACERLQD